MSLLPRETILWAGPSLWAETPDYRPVVPPEITLFPPAKRGDIARAVEAARQNSRPPGTLILADGEFHQSRAVSHAELRDAVGAGWQVWGVSSLGAIRAAELRDWGMNGWGDVFERFAAAAAATTLDPAADFPDDEVALLYGGDSPFLPVSEPLVHLRAALRLLANRGEISPATEQAAAADLAARWYGDRTWGLLRVLLMQAGGAVTVSTILSDPAFRDRCRVKTHDLAGLLGSLLSPQRKKT